MIEIKKRLLALPDRKESFELIKAFELLFNTQTLGSAALAGGASAALSTGSAFTALVGGTPVAKAAGVALAALNGPNVPNGGTSWQAWLLTVDALGNFYCYAGTPAATLAGVGLPAINAANGAQTAVGFVTMNNASAGAFVPGTTLLNVANLNLTINNIVGPFYPVLPV